MLYIAPIGSSAYSMRAAPVYGVTRAEATRPVSRVKPINSAMERQLSQVYGETGRNVNGFQAARQAERIKFPMVGKMSASEAESRGITPQEISALKRMDKIECQTCENRQYVDGSDDPTVSFQTPANIKPEQAASAVRSHEQEHVSNEQSDARKKGREIISQTVQIYTSICPECGKSYVSGGKTTTASRSSDDQSKQKAPAPLSTPFKSMAVDGYA